MILEFIKNSIRSIFSEEKKKKVVRIDKIEISNLKSQIQILNLAFKKILLDMANSGNPSLENEQESCNLAYSRNFAF